MPPPRGALRGGGAPAVSLSVRGTGRATGGSASPSSLAQRATARAPAAPARGSTRGVVASARGGAAPRGAATTRGLPRTAAPIAAPAPPAAPPPPPVPADEAPREPILGSVDICFNHYRQSFVTRDGCLRATAIDAAYSFSFAYKGNFRLHLVEALLLPTGGRAVASPGFAPSPPVPDLAAAREITRPPTPAPPSPAAVSEHAIAAAASETWLSIEEPSTPPHACGDIVFCDLPTGSVWRVTVEDDPAIAATASTSVYRGAESEASSMIARGPRAVSNRGVAELTQELKNLDVAELRQGSDKYKALLEARELEATLYGGSG
jgi:hypothetical protein